MTTAVVCWQLLIIVPSSLRLKLSIMMTLLAMILTLIKFRRYSTLLRLHLGHMLVKDRFTLCNLSLKRVARGLCKGSYSYNILKWPTCNRLTRDRNVELKLRLQLLILRTVICVLRPRCRAKASRLGSLLICGIEGIRTL